MGCFSSKDADPSIVCGSTIIKGRNVVIMDGQLLIPIEDQEKKDSSVIKIDLKHKKYEIIRGFHGRLYQQMITNEATDSEMIKNEINL